MRVQLEMTWRYNCNVSGSCDQCSIGRGTMWSTNVENVPWCKMEIGVQCSAVLPLLLSIFLNNATFTTMFSPMSLNIHFTPLPLSFIALQHMFHNFHTLLITHYYMSGGISE